MVLLLGAGFIQSCDWRVDHIGIYAGSKVSTPTNRTELESLVVETLWFQLQT
jgi:hypothetical protein